MINLSFFCIYLLAVREEQQPKESKVNLFLWNSFFFNFTLKYIYIWLICE